MLIISCEDTFEKNHDIFVSRKQERSVQQTRPDKSNQFFTHFETDALQDTENCETLTDFCCCDRTGILIQSQRRHFLLGEILFLISACRRRPSLCF